jgi:uncharacterized membrane protein YphA (DoxX/SURF4 family)
VGFSFKLEEYFSQGVLDLPFLMPYALTISIVVVIFEVVIGVFLLVGYHRKFAVWSLLLMILFFTFLTFYSAYFNKVTDCGCFGDAIKLTPWESFTKDIILLVLIVILFVGWRHITPLFTHPARRIIVLISLALSIGYVYHVLNHLPVLDFRPYKVGANIPEGMTVPVDAPRSIFEYAWKFDIGGEEKIIVTNGDYPAVDGEFIGVETKEIQEGYEAPIHDFTIEENGEDRAAALMQEDKLMLVIAYDLAKSDLEAFQEIKKATDKALKLGYRVAGLSASSEAIAGKVIADHSLDFKFFFTDETTLKTIVRANPGILILQRGTILQKLHYNDLDDLQLE